MYSPDNCLIIRASHRQLFLTYTYLVIDCPLPAFWLQACRFVYCKYLCLPYDRPIKSTLQFWLQSLLGICTAQLWQFFNRSCHVCVGYNQRRNCRVDAAIFRNGRLQHRFCKKKLWWRCWFVFVDASYGLLLWNQQRSFATEGQSIFEIYVKCRALLFITFFAFLRNFVLTRFCKWILSWFKHFIELGKYSSNVLFSEF